VGRVRRDDTDNNLEAQLAVSAVWTSVDVGETITTLTARGPSSYEGDPAQPVDALVAQVGQHPVVAALRAADEQFDRWVLGVSAAGGAALAALRLVW
jgi:hypothetical protein